MMEIRSKIEKDMECAMRKFAKLFEKGAEKLMIDEGSEVPKKKKQSKVSVNVNDDLFSC